MGISQGVGLRSGPVGGIRPPIMMAGKFRTPHHLIPTDYTLTLTANLMYVVPFWVDQTETYAGCKFYNSGAGDNGKKIRTGIYNELSTGGPNQKQVEFSEVTLSGASAIRTATGSVTLSGPAWYYVVLVSDTTPVMYCMASTQVVTTVGYANPDVVCKFLGDFSGPQITSSLQWPIGDTAAFSYAALPTTCPTPTATLLNPISGTHAANGTFPTIGLYK